MRSQSILIRPKSAERLFSAVISIWRALSSGRLWSRACDIALAARWALICGTDENKIVLMAEASKYASSTQARAARIRQTSSACGNGAPARSPREVGAMPAHHSLKTFRLGAGEGRLPIGMIG